MNKIIIIVAIIVIVAIVIGVVVMTTKTPETIPTQPPSSSTTIEPAPSVGTPSSYANSKEANNIPVTSGGLPPIPQPPVQTTQPEVQCSVIDRQTSVSVGCGDYVYGSDSDCNAQCGQCSNKIKIVTDNSSGGKTSPCSVSRLSPVYIGCGYGYFDKSQFDKQCGQLSKTGKWIGDSLPKMPASYIRYSSRNNFMSY